MAGPAWISKVRARPAGVRRAGCAGRAAAALRAGLDGRGRCGGRAPGRARRRRAKVTAGPACARRRRAAAGVGVGVSRVARGSERGRQGWGGMVSRARAAPLAGTPGPATHGAGHPPPPRHPTPGPGPVPAESPATSRRPVAALDSSGRGPTAEGASGPPRFLGSRSRGESGSELGAAPGVPLPRCRSHSPYSWPRSPT